MSSAATGGAAPLADPALVHRSTLLGFSTSLKPGAGIQGRSAARSLLSRALAAVAAVHSDVMLLDLRNHRLPLFDGRLPHEHDDPEVAFIGECVQRCGALLFSVGAYWSGVSGVFKNVVDVLAGPIYDLPPPRRTVFTDKPVGILVVGADPDSARRGAEQVEATLRSVGAVLLAPSVVVADPRAPDVDLVAPYSALVATAAELAHRAMSGQGREGAT